MKAQVLFFILIYFSSIIKAQCVNGDSIVYQGHIFLSGGWDKGTVTDKGHRSATFAPIVATIENNCISIDFWNIVDNVAIAITKKDGVEVYSQSLFVNEIAQLSIPIGIYPPGVYLLKFSNKEGGYVSGWFEVK